MLGVVVALLLLANWVSLYLHSDKMYQFQDGEMRVVPSHMQAPYRKAHGVSALNTMPSNDAAQAAAAVTAAQFGVLDTYFNAAVGLCPSQRENIVGASTSAQNSLMVSAISTQDFRFFLDAAVGFDTGGSPAESILDVSIAM